jgi:hypothetical protein
MRRLDWGGLGLAVRVFCVVVSRTDRVGCTAAVAGRIGRGLRQNLASQAHGCERHASFGQRQPPQGGCGICLHEWLLEKMTC